MSERGSFVTEYMYCDECFKAAKAVLLGFEKHLCSVPIPSWEGGGKELPIIAGKIGGLYENEELYTFESEFKPKLEKVLCKDHGIRIAILPDSGESKVMYVSSKKE